MALKAKYSKIKICTLVVLEPYISLYLILVGKFIWQCKGAFSLRKGASFLVNYSSTINSKGERGLGSEDMYFSPL